MRHTRSQAFTLIEILVVIAIMAVLLSIVAPILNSTMDAGLVTQAATIVANEFTIGHLKAIAENRPITLRFIRKDAASSFDRMQLIVTDAQGNTSAVDRVTPLPQGTAIAKSATLSTFLDTSVVSENNATNADPPVPGFGKAYRYIQFSFRPRGSLDLDITKQWFATVVFLRDDKPSGVPANFVTLQLDPVNGGLCTYRP